MKLISIFQTLNSVERFFFLHEFVFINECVNFGEEKPKKNVQKYRHTGYDTSNIESHVINVHSDCRLIGEEMTVENRKNGKRLN